MKTIWVATPYAGKIKAVFISKIMELRLLIIFLLVISCSKSDYFVEPQNETPVDKQMPNDEEASNGNDTSTDGESVIIYTDVEPDFNSGTGDGQYNLDLDNDGHVDFVLTSSLEDDWFASGIKSDSNSTNGILSLHPWYSHPAALDKGQKIFNLSTYKDGESYESGVNFAYGYCFPNDDVCRYNWEDKGDRYVGLRFLINKNIHYGWARLEFLSASKWIIKDYAYHASPNTAILAGEMN